MIGQAARLGLFTLAGLLLGAAQFASLRSSVRRYVRGDALASAIAFQVARMLVFAASWVLLARIGRAPGLLAAFIGFLIARPVTLAWRRERT